MWEERTRPGVLRLRQRLRVGRQLFHKPTDLFGLFYSVRKAPVALD